ncbi:MAG: aminotransferase class III-fold pyridoxal phosphate-dependent enzyme [Pseudomonadota bacterium]
MDQTHNQTLEQIDRRTVFHPNTDLAAFADGRAESTIVTGAEGIRIRDGKGREWIDAFASLWCVNIGYGRREIAETLHRQTLEMAYYHSHAGHSSEPVIQLTDRVLRMCPPGMSRIFWGLQGSDAHETQVKIIRYYNNVLGRPAKKKLIARQRAYHGLTCMSASLLGVPKFHAGFDLPLPGVLHVSAPYYFHRADEAMDERAFSAMLADELDGTIRREGADTVAAFFAEPVVGVGGVIPSPAGYWEAILPVLAQHDVLLVADEVVTGFGRMGTDFGAGFYGLKPDMMTISKGLTSGYFPLAGSVVNERVWSVLAEGSARYGPFAHGFTYAAHPLGAAVAMTNLDIIAREGLTENAARMGARLRQGLTDALGDHPMVGDIRGEGLLACVEFVADRARRTLFDPALGIGPRLARACRDEGLIVRPLPDGDMLGYAPPLTLTAEDVDQIVGRTARAVARETDAIRAEGLWPR